MIKSMYSAVSGIKSFQTKMDVIGNNIANVNTVGFKASRVIFKDMFYQTISGASAPTPVKGGTNPRQIGFGATTANIVIQNSRSGIEQTDRLFDLYISGEGYFTVKDGDNNTYYTRVGNFNFDVNGNLVDSNGNYVCGPSWQPGPDASPIRVNNLQDYSNISIGKDGIISGINTFTGMIDNLGQITLAKFANPDALQQDGSMYNIETVNSGRPQFSQPGSGTGMLVTGGLEMSNVDLSREFTDMIITQRGLQANARVITTSDEILQELVGLKR